MLDLARLLLAGLTSAPIITPAPLATDGVDHSAGANRSIASL
jgi:hypothetical protein